MALVSLTRAAGWEFRSGSHSPAAANDLSAEIAPTGVVLSLGLTSGVADDAAMNSDKADFGANRAPRLACFAAIEWFSVPTTGERVDLYMAWSPDATSTDANPGYVDGTDGDYTGTPATLDEGLAQLDFIGSVVASADVVVQVVKVATVVPAEQWGTLVVVNRSGAVICGTDDIETSIVMHPMHDDVATS